MSGLSHVGPDGAVTMVDVGDKPLSRRRAVARASVLDGGRRPSPGSVSFRRAMR